MSGPRRIWKMSGAGNDFVVLGLEEARELGAGAPEWARRVCRRGLSVGADGVLLVEPFPGGAVRVRFLNPDGEEAFCGNGSRCAARYAFLRGYAGRTMTLETAAGSVRAEITGDCVSVALPLPEDLGDRCVEAGGRRFEGRLVAAGVPHFIVRVAAVSEAPLEVWGPALRRHPSFGPSGTNVDLVEARADALSIRTWERGVEGETLACGSGAVAAAWAHRALAPGAGPVAVVPRSGVPLRVEFAGRGGLPETAILTGDARLVFEATLSDEAVSGWAP